MIRATGRLWAARVLLVGTVLLLGAATGAQTTPDANPRTVADSFLAAVNERRWDAAARRLDLEIIKSEWQGVVNGARSALPQPPETVESVMARDSTVPRAVAEWQVAQMKKYQDLRALQDFSDEYAGVTSFRELASLSVEDAAARWLEAQDERYRYRRAMELSNCSRAMADSALALLELPPWRVVAVAVASDSVAYALAEGGTQARMADAPSYVGSPPKVLVLRRRSAIWLIAPRFSLLGDRMMTFDVRCEPSSPK